ncbi:pre-mRNA-splicing factor rse1 [Malassezia sp. CBS 17886]|nr:pre-mRNA-splicing factor rse1 [Malassezia sp. CBS 17886]
MHLYNVSLQPPSAVTAAVAGQFSGSRAQEIVVARGNRLELYQMDTQEGRMTRVFAQNVFGNIRSIACFRLTGGSKDYLIVGSDSGRIVILEYQVKENTFTKVHQETFGRSGNRRVIPGQYLATDPKGRAVLIGAVEKAKLIYILNRDAEANLTISSPLEAHRATAICESIVGVDVGYENPLFASLETDYAEADRDPSGEALRRTEKRVTYYELDLGLNHVVRRWSDPVAADANHLIQVPGGYNHNTERWDGPSGVLVCMENYIVYKHHGQPDHRVPIPQRANPVAQPERGTMIVASVLHKMKSAFFFLVQTEEGDLFKVTLDHDEEEIQGMRIKYFDTVPVAASLVILRAGFLYVASETGPQQLYSFQKLGDDDDLPEYMSTAYLDNGADAALVPVPTFTPRALDNIALVDELAAMDPIMDAHACNAIGAEAAQIYAACGRGAGSIFRQLRHGLEVHEVVSSELPGVPNAIWATKLRSSDAFDRFIVLSFVNGTLVLSIGETIEEVADSGFLTSVPTLSVQQIGADAVLQVHPQGIRHILASGQVNEWLPPAREDGSATAIVASATNERQVAIALSSNEIVYFELDMDGQLNEYQERRDIGAAVVAMSMATCPEGRQRTPYLAVGCADQTVRIVSLDPDTTLASISIQALTALPSSICVNEMLDVTVDRNHLTMFVSIGLENGVHLRTVLDPVNGQLTDTRTRFLGNRPVKLVRVRVQAQPAVMALSSRSWLAYTHQARMHFTPLLFDALEQVSSFHAELCPEGLIGVIGDTLRIFTITHLGDELQVESLPLTYTPRKMIMHTDDPTLFYIAEADNRTLSPAVVAQRLAEANGAASGQGALELDPRVYGHVRGNAGEWAACLRVVHAPSMQSVSTLPLAHNEAAFSLAMVPFASAGNETFLVVGSAVGARFFPRSQRVGYLSTYRLADKGRRLELVHKTELDEVPLALSAFQGRLLAGTGAFLRIYEMGRKKLLRKCQSKPFPSSIVTLNVHTRRVIVGDMRESVFFVSYKPTTNKLVVFADDFVPRWTSTVVMLDYETVAASDRFGNVYVLRIESDVSRAADEDSSGIMIETEKPFLGGAGSKVQIIAHYHVGDLVTSLRLTSLVPGGRDILVYTGLSGSIGAFVPLLSREDSTLLTTLEMHMRQENYSLVGRSHLAYRGAFVPVKACVDGELCERFGLLPHEKQASIAEALDKTPGDINKKLAQLREMTAGF